MKMKNVNFSKTKVLLAGFNKAINMKKLKCVNTRKLLGIGWTYLAVTLSLLT